MNSPEEIKTLYKNLREFSKGVEKGEGILREYSNSHYYLAEDALRNESERDYYTEMFREGIKLVMEEQY